MPVGELPQQDGAQQAASRLLREVNNEGLRLRPSSQEACVRGLQKAQGKMQVKVRGYFRAKSSSSFHKLCLLMREAVLMAADSSHSQVTGTS